VSVHGEGGEIIEPLGASTMPQSVLPSPSQFGSTVGAPAPVDTGSAGLDLDLDLGDPETGAPTSPSPLEPARVAMPVPHHDAHDDMSLDFSLPEVPELQSKAPRAVEPSTFDLSDISLDLDMPHETPHVGAPASHSAFGDIGLPSLDGEGDDDPLSRKLELAEEFRQIGDTDGARDLLHEVVAKSTGAVKSRAQSMLADLG
jgi:pilus assembly protein FimV